MRILLTLAAALTLAACQPERTPPDPIAGSAGAEVAPAEDNPTAGSQYDPMTRAKAVEPAVMDQKAAQDKAMEEQGG